MIGLLLSLAIVAGAFVYFRYFAPAGWRTMAVGAWWIGVVFLTEAVARLNDVLGTLASNPQIADMLSDPVVAQLLAQFVPPDWVGILIGLTGFALRSLRAVTSGPPEKPVRPGDNFTGA